MEFKFSFLDKLNDPVSQPSQPIDRFKEPVLQSSKMFGKYCAIYDPTVLTKSVKVFDPNDDDRDFNSWAFNTISILLDEGIEEIDYCYYCLSRYQEVTSKAKLLSLLNRYVQKLEEGKEDSVKLVEKLYKSLNPYYFIKQYVFYKLTNGETGWAVILRGRKSHQINSDNRILGLGATLPEADINFVNNRIKQFKICTTRINELVDLDTPVTKEEMLDACTELDKTVKPNSVTRKFRESDFGLVESSFLSMVCKSDTRQFLLESSEDYSKWTVITFINVDNNMVGKLSLEGKGNTLKEAFDKSESTYLHLKANPEKLEQAVYEAEQEEFAALLRDDDQGDGEHIHWLISEYGEDVIPDRG